MSVAKPDNLLSILELNMVYRENTSHEFPFDLQAHTCLGRSATVTYTHTHTHTHTHTKEKKEKEMYLRKNLVFILRPHQSKQI